MPSWKTLFKNDNFIAAVELEGKRSTMTIDRLAIAELEQENGTKKPKGVIWFKEISRGWVFAKTAGYCLAAMFGDDYTKWSGKRVTLHSELVQVGAKKEPGIRITGSPDITGALEVKIKLAKKKAFVVKLVPTGKLEAAAMKDPPKVPVVEESQQTGENATPASVSSVSAQP